MSKILFYSCIIMRARLLVIFLFIFFLVHPANAKEDNKPAESLKEIYKMLGTFSKVLDKIKAEYVEQKSIKELVELAINGMLSGLDPHSSYLNKKSFTKMREYTKGEFGGVGIEFNINKKGVEVISPITGTPAYKAGIKSGDIILQVDKTLLVDPTNAKIAKIIRGKPGTSVKLKIQRNNKIFDIKIVRAIIKISPVTHEAKNNIGYLKVSTFNEKTAANLQQSIKELTGQNKIQGYILDLRDNPGGLLKQSILVADMFLDSGEIVSTKGRNGSAQRFSSTKGDLTQSLPIVVLINHGSASASEIVAGALKDNKRAIIIGNKSFGKGSVQTITKIDENTAVRMTTARYYTPSGQSIQSIGITPDIEISQGKLQKTEFVSYSEKDLPNALVNKQKKSQNKNNNSKNNYQDYQLLSAINILKGIILTK